MDGFNNNDEFGFDTFGNGQDTTSNTNFDSTWGTPNGFEQQNNDGFGQVGGDPWGVPSEQAPVQNNVDSAWGTPNDTWGVPENNISNSEPNSPQNDAWGQTTTDDWNNGVNTEPNFDTFGGNQNFDATQQMQQPNFDNSDNADVIGLVKQATNGMSKKTGLIIAMVGLLLFAIIIFYLAGAKVSKKTNQNVQNATNTIVENNTPTDANSVVDQPDSTTTDTQVHTEPNTTYDNEYEEQPVVDNSQTSTPAANTTSFIEIPTETTLNYDGDVYSANGIVKAKTKYLYGNQVVYCISLDITAGSATQEVNYFCNYSSFTAVKSGDMVTVDYQQVADGYISVNSISK